MKQYLPSILTLFLACLFPSVMYGEAETDSTFYQLYLDYKDSNRDKAIAYAERFISDNPELEKNEETARLLMEIGNYYRDEAFAFSKAIAFNKRALEIYESRNDLRNIGRVSLEIADLYNMKKEYDLSIDFLIKSHNAAKVSQDTLTILKNYNQLGIIYLLCGENDNAKTYFEKYLKGARETSDSSLISFAYNNMAAYENLTKDTTGKVPLLLSEAIGLCPHDRQDQLFKLKINLASYYLTNGKHEQFLKLIGEVEPLAEDTEEKARVYYNLGWYYMLIKDSRQAISNLETALGYYNQGEFPDAQKDILTTLSDLYAREGNINKAYYYLKQSANHEFSSKKERENTIKFFQYRNTIERNANEYTIQSIRQKQRLTITIIASASVALISIFVAVFIFLSFKKKKELLIIEQKKIENERIEKEIKETAELKKIYEYKNNRLINTIYEDLKTLQTKIDDTIAKNEINAIARKLFDINKETQDSMSIDSKYIPEFNSELINRLSADFPNLTINDKRLCAFLNLNLSTKEISEITKQNPQSINIARARLRKKIGLSGTDTTIQEFLLKYTKEHE